MRTNFGYVSFIYSLPQTYNKRNETEKTGGGKHANSI